MKLNFCGTLPENESDELDWMMHLTVPVFCKCMAMK
jgi:hypothetical protein